jgi:branched-chain amino acid aminotransferase
VTAAGVRAVWLDGALVPPGRAALSIDDPGARWGEGLFETMRAEGGRVGLLERHLDRLEASAAALGLAPMPARAAMRAAVAAALAASGADPARVRLTATPRPTLLAEVVPEAPLPPEPPAVTAVTVRGGWSPGNRAAEHKTLSYLGHRVAQRAAERAGAGHALLLDAEGRMGEAALANVFVATAAGPVTAPARGLLPGVARAIAAEAVGAREEAPDEAAWRAAPEIVLTNAVAGALAVVAVDGRPVGDGRPGALARAIATALRAALGSVPAIERGQRGAQGAEIA